MNAISLKNVGFRYDIQWVLKEVSCEIAKGEFVGILGPNGSGKTTLLKILDGMLTPQEGEGLIGGVPIRTIGRNELAKTVAVVSQDFRMTFPFSVREVVLMGRSPHLARWRFEGETDLRIAEQAMELTDTLSFAARNIDQLSGGERQRVFIARALAQKPQILLLDEPTAFLDLKHQMDFFDLVKSLNRKNNLTVVAVTHDIHLASVYADRLILMKEGRLLVQGRPEEVITEANISEVYRVSVRVDADPDTNRPRVTPIGKFFIGQ